MVAWPVLRPYLWPLRPRAMALAPLRRMFRLGAPIGAQFFLEFGVFGVIGIAMGWLGTIPMASHQVAINLASLTFMAAVGVNASGREVSPDGAALLAVEKSVADAA